MRPKPITMALTATVWLVWLLASAAGTAAQEQDEPPPQPAAPSIAPPITAPPSTAQSICLMMESAATANGLPLEFFARLIWRESNFRTNAVGPVTRSGERAQGIAQFMPGTAAERGLLNPFDPVQALPKSAEFLRELLAEFGNLGLAAAAYNAGPQRVRDWLEGRRTLPDQTRRYVEAITGHTPEEWSGAAATGKAPPDNRPARKNPSCNDMMALLKEQPSVFVEQLQQRVNKSVASPWGVQISAGFSREKALVSYSTIESRHRQNLAGLDPIILQTTLRSRGTHPFYQVRIGADTRDSANRLCGRLRTDGVACMVLRNRT